MNSSGPYNPSIISYEVGAPIGILVEWKNKKDFHYFVMAPMVNAPVNITGNATFNFWAMASANNSLMDLTVRILDSLDTSYGADTLIQSQVIFNENFLSPQVTLHTVTLTSLNYILPANHYLILQIQREDALHENLYIGFDQSYYDSTLSMRMVSHAAITDNWTQDIDGNRRTEFGDQETIRSLANLTDSLGIYDLLNATVVVRNLDSNSTVLSQSMSINSTGPATLQAWTLFECALGPLQAGNYSINVTALDNSLNQMWAIQTIRVVRVDHFDIAVSSVRVTAGEDFNLTIEAIDAGGMRMLNWSGMLSLQAIENSTGLPISGLSNGTVFMSSSHNGIVNVSEIFTLAPYRIRVLVMNGTSYGESLPIDVVPGPIVTISVTPDQANITAGATIVFTANATDMYGNNNDSWQPYWTITPPNAILIVNGFTVQLYAVSIGNAMLMCRDNATGMNFTVNVTITTAALSWIVVTPDNGTIWEGETVAIHAYGFDSFANPVGIPTAIWSSEGFAMSLLMGTGQSGSLMAGMAPETGTARVTVGLITGFAQISVVTPPFGPSLGALPNQVGLEDVPWKIDLALYWKDLNGTNGLSWFVTGVDDSLLIITHNGSSPSIVNFIPQPNANGVNDVIFWIRDPTGYTNLKQVSITVLPVNDPPAFINDPPNEIYVKFGLPYSFDYSYYVEDVDDNNSQLMLNADPSTYIVASGLVLTYTFPDLYNGEPYYRIVKLVISDGTSSDDVTIKIWATTDTPPDLITPLPDITINEGDINALAFDLDDYFDDIDGDVLYYSQGFEHVEITIVQGTNLVLISSPSEWSGQTTAVFIAFDPTGAIKIDTINITVIPINDPPQIAEIRTFHVHYDVQTWLDLRLYVTDPDNGFEELTIVTSDPTNISFAIVPYPHLVILYPANATGGSTYVGSYTVNVILYVTDNGALGANQPFSILVSDNNPPVLVMDPPEFIGFLEDTVLGKPYSIDLQTLFTDVDGDQLTFNHSGNVNISILITADGWVNFSASENWYGNELIIFTATDAEGAWASFMVRVDVIPVNDPPVLNQIIDIVHYGGRQWTLSISSFIHDVDDPDLSGIEIIIVSPAYVRAVGLDLYFEFPADVDSIQVTIYVYDGESDSNYMTFKVEIRKTIGELIGYPWSLIAVMLIAGIAGYFMAFRIFPHKLEELFIIHNDGRLIYHEGKMNEHGMDQDVVSAMFTAVQEFIKDSFKEDTGGLKMLEIGDRKVVIEKGRWIYAALIYSGWPPKSVFRDLTHFIQDIENGYGSSIEHWDGTLRSLPGMQSLGKDMLMKKYHTNHEHPNGINRSDRFEDLKAEEPSNEKKP